MRTRLVAAVLGLLLAAPAALAQTRSKAEPTCADLYRQGKKCKDIVIEGEQVGGKVVWPQGAVMVGRTFDPGPSLIRLRNSFADKIVASAEDL